MVIKATAVFAGLVAALFAWLLAWAGAGGGHGWVAPAFYSPSLFLLYPAILLRAAGTGPSSLRLDLVLLAAAAMLDLALAVGTWRNESVYFERAVGHPLTWLWISLWLSWQMVAVANVVQRLGSRSTPRN
jgi:hypothetical protein